VPVGRGILADTIDGLTATLLPMPAAQGAGSRTILFTAFEPSGDAHAAPVIRALVEQDPSVRIAAWGGPRMREAGAEMIGITAEDGAMGLAGLSKISLVRRVRREVAEWSLANRVVLHVPVDSPAANFPVVKAIRPRGIRTVHLVAPQMWAWGEWRLAKLRRLTDLVLCLLPFEEAWFRERGVQAAFIGHPVINRGFDDVALAASARHLPSGSPKVALLPGSRSQELRANLRAMVEAFIELQGRHRGMTGVIVAANENLARLAVQLVPSMPNGLHVVVGELDGALRWCDLAINVSGTVSLDVARHGKPMVGVYRVDWVSYLLSKLVLRAPHRLLPNIIAGKEIVPEFVPTALGAQAFAEAADAFLKDSRRAAATSAELRRMMAPYAGHRPGPEAAALILRVLAKGALSKDEITETLASVRAAAQARSL